MNESDFNNEKQEFIDNTFFSNAWRDTSQHVRIFKEGVSDEEKKNFRSFVRGASFKIVEEYKKKQLTEKEHLRELKKIYDGVNDKYSSKVEFSFGRTQKLVNVLLK